MENISQPKVQALVRADCVAILNKATRDDEAFVTAHMVIGAEPVALMLPMLQCHCLNLIALSLLKFVGSQVHIRTHI